jgi:hypothetical protein
VRKDYNGNPRPQGLGFDRGAFESAGTFTPPVTEYAIFRAPNSPMIDGDLSEFQATEFITITQPETGDQGTFKFLWDDSALYVAAWVTDSQLNAEIVEKDGSLWEEDSLELMFDTLHNHGTCLQADDYKFFVNLLNTHRDSQGGDESWDGAYDSVVRLSGSNNDNNDVDQGYSIEMCIPWSSMNLSSPSPGVIWGLDVGLNDRDATGTRYNAAWANIDGGSLNNPDGWGAVEFVADTPTSD